MATAFVLAGGGSLGATAVGMPAALTDADVHPDFVVGTSVGAANAAWFALTGTVIPVHVGATDVLPGEEVLLSSGNAVDAVLDLVDGGAVHNTPVPYVVDLGADRVWVLPTGYACAVTLLVDHRLELDVERCRGQVELRVVPPLCPACPGQ